MWGLPLCSLNTYNRLSLGNTDGKFWEPVGHLFQSTSDVDSSVARSFELEIKKKSESPTGIKPISSRTPVGCSNHSLSYWETRGELFGSSGARGAPWVRKFGNPLIRKILVLTSAYVRPSVRPYRLWGRVTGVPRQPDRGRWNDTFSCS